MVLVPKILICDSIHDQGVEMFSRVGFAVTYRPKITPDELLRLVSEFDAIVVRGRTKVTRAILDAGKKIKVVGRAGVGLDNIDLEAAKAKNIQVLNTPEASTTSVGELVLAHMLAVTRGITRADHAMKNGRWIKNELMGTELEGKTLGVVGMGRIGVKVARIAKAFGMKIIGYDVIPISQEIIKELEARIMDLETLLKESDYITLHVPLTQETRHVINEERINRMKDGAIIINASRGATIDENALYRALQSGKLKGAALDVFEMEPPTDSKLVNLPNVVCTPHIGAETLEAQERATKLLVDKMSDILL